MVSLGGFPRVHRKDHSYPRRILSSRSRSRRVTLSSASRSVPSHSTKSSDSASTCPGEEGKSVRISQMNGCEHATYDL